MYSCILQTKKRCKCEFKLQIKEWKKKKKKAFKSESVFSIVNKPRQRFFSLSFVLGCYNNFHQRQNATNISVFLSHSETLHCENKLAKEF